MLSFIHIYRLFNSKDFKESSCNERKAMLYAKYQKCCEKNFFPDWYKNWKYIQPFVEELVMCDMQATKLLVTETTWSNRVYNYQILNLEEIKHNKKLVTLWIAIQKLLGDNELADYLYMRDVKFYANKAIQNSMEQFLSENNSIKINFDIVEACTIRYFYISTYTQLAGMEAFNNSTSTEIVEAVIY